MGKQEQIIDQVKQQRVLPLFYHEDKTVCIEVTKALYAAGVRVIEFTNRGEAALENFKALVQLRNESLNDLLLAVGTIRTGEQAEKFIQAEADFLISPVFDTEVCDIAYMHKVLWVPGCMTPTEIHTAQNAGCKLVKLFPGNILGAGFVSGIKELFPGMLFMPTGGVEPTKESMAAWFNAGVIAVGMGSKLIDKNILRDKKYEELQTNTSRLLETARTI